MNNKEKLYLVKFANKDVGSRVNKHLAHVEKLINKVPQVYADTFRSAGMSEDKVKENMDLLGYKYEKPLLPYSVRSVLGTSHGNDFWRGNNLAAYGVPAGAGALAGGMYGLMKDPDEEEDESRIGNAVSGAGWGGALGLAAGAGLANYKQPLVTLS